MKAACSLASVDWSLCQSGTSNGSKEQQHVVAVKLTHHCLQFTSVRLQQCPSADRMHTAISVMHMTTSLD